MPKISVVMPVYNGEKYIREAIDSILNQTLSDFEFIIIDDGSADNTESIIKSYKDNRIKYIKNEKNLGVAETLNKGFDTAEGEYIARMDADDVSLPERFEKQVDFLDKNIDISVCGCEVELMGNIDKKETYTVFGKENMKINLLFSSCLCHPAVMIRRKVFEKENYRYDTYYDKIEDYELWTRVIMKYNMDNVHGVLFRYRVHENQVTQNYSEKHREKLKELKEKQLKLLGVEFTSDESNAFFDFCRNDMNYTDEIMPLATLFEKIYKRNETIVFYDKDLLKNYLKAVLISSMNRQEFVKADEVVRVCGILNKNDIRKQKLKSWIKSCIKRG